MDLDKETEQQRLRLERDRLNRQIATLVAESVRVRNSPDPIERDHHQDEIERHQEEFRAFRADLERFHRLYGPLGES